jgi:hypothetical protein
MEQVWDVSEVYMNVFAVQVAAVYTNMAHAHSVEFYPVIPLRKHVNFLKKKEVLQA